MSKEAKSVAVKCAIAYFIENYSMRVARSRREDPFVVGIGSGTTVELLFPLLVDYLSEQHSTSFVVAIATSHQAQELIYKRAMERCILEACGSTAMCIVCSTVLMKYT